MRLLFLGLRRSGDCVVLLRTSLLGLLPRLSGRRLVVEHGFSGSSKMGTRSIFTAPSCIRSRCLLTSLERSLGRLYVQCGHLHPANTRPWLRRWSPSRLVMNFLHLGHSNLRELMVKTGPTSWHPPSFI